MQKKKENSQIVSIFMRNLYFHFAAEQCRPVLRQWCLNPKEIEGKNWNCRKVNHMWKVVCASSFAKKGHEPFIRNLICGFFVIFWPFLTLFLPDIGGFQLLDLIIQELKSHVIPYKFKSSHWLKSQHSDWRANLVKDFFWQIKFPSMRDLEFLTGHVTFKLLYNQI